MTQIEESFGSETEKINYDDILSDDEPNIPEISKATVDLPGGIYLGQGLVTSVTVRELTGYDEEELARADVKKPMDYLSRLLKLGTKEIGGEPPNDFVLQQLLIGDRDAIVLGIRRATFGDTIELVELECPECHKDFDVTLDIDEFEVKKLDDPADRIFQVQLRNGMAKVRLATHGDVIQMVDLSQKIVEQNTLLLSRCVESIGGKELNMTMDGAESIIRGLGMRDRQVLLKELADRQPGPNLQGVKISCPSCNHEDVIDLDLLNLFRI